MEGQNVGTWSLGLLGTVAVSMEQIVCFHILLPGWLRLLMAVGGVDSEAMWGISFVAFVPLQLLKPLVCFWLFATIFQMYFPALSSLINQLTSSFHQQIELVLKLEACVCKSFWIEKVVYWKVHLVISRNARFLNILHPTFCTVKKSGHTFNLILYTFVSRITTKIKNKLSEKGEGKETFI